MIKYHSALLVGAALFLGTDRAPLGGVRRCAAQDAPATQPSTPDDFERLGSDLFRARKFTESVAAFDRELQLAPARAPWHWKRGIALYYAGRFDDGARQFEGYQTVDDSDVENAVWRFLCQARDPNVGLAEARRRMLKINDDGRVPMQEIYRLYRGDVAAAAVLAACRDGVPTEEQLSQRLFYGHLYLGLFEEVQGRREAAIAHYEEAARRRIDHFMGDVAVVQLELMRQ